MSEDWKSRVRGKMRSAYGAGRLGLQLAVELDPLSPQDVSDSFALFATILKLRRETLLDYSELKHLYRLAQKVDRDGIAGDWVECGVYRGGSAALLAFALRSSHAARRLWLFDSFRGLPRPTPADGPHAPRLEGQIVGDEQGVRRLLQKVSAPEDRVHILPGWFQETLPQARIERVALLHLDADWYESIRLCLEHFYDLLEPGAVVILDDYFSTWPGCRAAFEEFTRARSLCISLQQEAEAPPYFRKPG